MATWPQIKLGEISRIYSGFAFRSQDLGAQGIPVLKIANIQNKCVVPECADHLPEELCTDKLKRFFLHPDDTLIAMTGAGSVGKVGKMPSNSNRFLVNQRVAIVRPDSSRCEPAFVYFALSQDYCETKLYSLGLGAGQPNVSAKQIGELELPFPPLPIQQRIAGILSAYNELIENSQRRIKILEQMARNLYREWFVNFWFPNHAKTPLVDSPSGKIPKGWEMKTVGEIAETFRGRSYRSVDLAEEGGLPFLNLKCLDRDGGFRRSGLKRYVGEYKNSHVAKKGDIVVAVTDMTQDRRIVARAARIPTLDSVFGVFSMDLIRIEPKQSIPKVFLYAFLRYSSFADEVKEHANGANVLHLSPERITAFQFPVPPNELMVSFAGIVEPILEQIDVLENKVENLRKTRDLLLPRLLSGQIKVN